MSNPPPNSWQSLAWIVFMILVTALAVVVLCAQPADAGNTLGTWGAAIRVRGVDCTNRRCSTREGTGTMIGKSRTGALLVLTCSHVVPETMSQSMRVEIAAGDWREAEIAKIDRRADICLLSLPFDREVRTCGVSDQPPQANEWLMSIGYAQGRLRAINVNLTGRDCEDGLWWEYRQPFIEGESGGPIISKGGVVGVITARAKCGQLFQNGRIISGPTGFAVAYPVVKRFVADLVAEEQVVERPSIVIPPPAAAPAKPEPPAQVGNSPTPTAPAQPPAGEPAPSLADKVDKLAGLVQTGVTVASWLGIAGASGGTAWAAWAGLSLLRRVLGRSKPVATQQPSMHLPPATQPVPQPVPVIPTETPPPPQVVIPTTQYAPYEVDSFAQAFAWAESEYVRKYPGAVGTVEGIKSLITQYLAAKGIKVK